MEKIKLYFKILFEIGSKIFQISEFYAIKYAKKIEHWFLSLDRRDQKSIVIYSIPLFILFLLIISILFAPPPTRQELELQASQKAESDKQEHDREIQAEAEAKRQSDADALTESNRRVEEERQEADRAAKDAADAANAPTNLTGEICKDAGFRDSLKSLFDNGIKRLRPELSILYGDVTDITLYHITSEVNADNVVCTSNVTVTMQNQNGVHVETYSGMEIGLIPGKGGNYNVRILSPGTRTM